MVKIKFEKNVDLKKCFISGGSMYDFGRIDAKVMGLPIVKEIIEDIDGGTILTPDIIKLPKYNNKTIPVGCLAGGTQALLYLLSNPEYPIKLAAFGENCYKYLWRISNMVDYDIILSATGRETSPLDYSENGDWCICLNDGSAINSDHDFYELGWRYVRYDWERR